MPVLDYSNNFQSLYMSYMLKSKYEKVDQNHILNNIYTKLTAVITTITLN